MYIVECGGVCFGVVLHEVACHGLVFIFTTDTAHVAFAETRTASKKPIYKECAEYKSETVELMVRLKCSKRIWKWALLTWK